MKNALLVLFCFALGAVSALGQVVLDSGTASLSSVATTTVASVGSGTGTLKAVACSVTGGASAGSTAAGLRVTLDSVHTTTYTLYSGSDVWVNSLLPFITQAGAFPGATLYDAFVLPLNVDYTSGLTIDIHVTAAGSAGSLTCSALHT